MKLDSTLSVTLLVATFSSATGVKVKSICVMERPVAYPVTSRENELAVLPVTATFSSTGACCGTVSASAGGFVGVTSIGDVRGAYAQNTKKLSTYYACIDAGRLPTEKGLVLTAEDKLRRHVVTQLMCNFFIDAGEIQRRFGVDFHEHFSSELERLDAPEPESDWAGFWFHRRILKRRLAPVCRISYLRTARVAVTPVASTVERITQRIIQVDHAGKPAFLAQLLKEEPVDRALVFTRTKHGADRVVRHLATAGVNAAAIHGNKSQGQRVRALDLGGLPVERRPWAIGRLWWRDLLRCIAEVERWSAGRAESQVG